MDFGGGSNQGQGQSSNRKGKKVYHRHTNNQIQILEAFFKRCQHPDENQRNNLANEVGLDARQVKFWFQNKRTQVKTQTDKSSNNALRTENEMIMHENEAIKEAIKNVLCIDCGGPPPGDEERQRSLEELQLQNALLKEELDRVGSFLSTCIGKPVSAFEKLVVAGFPGESSSSTPQIRGSDQLSLPTGQINTALFPYTGQLDKPMERTTFMVETASSAFDELIRLLQVDEPLWIKPSNLFDGRSTLYRDAYEKIILVRVNFLNRSGIGAIARYESSKHSGIVSLNGLHIVNMLLDPNNWADMFPTIVTKARTMETIENGALGSRHGALHLMYGKMHIFSPLVPPREFYFLRHCKQVEDGTWVIVDISIDFERDTDSPTDCWRLPSGCMIQALPDGSSKVTWVEHVQVNDKGELHKLFKDLVRNNCTIAFGAERWVSSLQRMCQRFAYSSKLTESLPIAELNGATIMPGGKRGIMTLCHRMVKIFSEMLEMSGKLDFPLLSEENCSGIRLSIRKGMEEGQPLGIIATASTTLWLPIPPQLVFDFFIDYHLRLQWDVLSDGRHGVELLKITTGDNPGNFISVRKHMVPTQNNMVVIQETCVDASGSMLVYAPIDYQGLGYTVRGDIDTSALPILPSGFIITSDGRGPTNHDMPTSYSSAPMASYGGSLLTVAYQILISSDKIDMESISNVNALISSTVQKIKVCFNCDHLD